MSIKIIDATPAKRGEAGTTKAMRFTILLDKPADVPVTVHAATKDYPYSPKDSASAREGMAKEGVDYEHRSGIVTIPAGETSGTFEVTVNGSDEHHSKVFLVELSEGSQPITKKQAAGILMFGK